MEKEHDASQQHDTPSDKVESSKQSTTTTANSTFPLPADDPDTLLTVGAFPTRPSDIVSWLDPTLSSLSSALSGHDEKNNISLQDMLEDKLPKALYGQWYHNVAVLFITALVAFLLGKLRVEMGAVIIGCFVIGKLSYSQEKKSAHHGIIHSGVLSNQYAAISLQQTQ